MRSLIISALFTLPLLVPAQDSLKSYKALRIQSPPKIDGILSDEVWNAAEAMSDFVMKTPDEGKSPTQKTEVKIVYDNYAVYVGAMMYDNSPDSILHELGNRDDGGLNADFFRFVIDPYNTRQDAYDFGVYASGVQYDLRFSDYTYDAVWESSVKITDKGWAVEMKIPYSAFRFPAKNVQEWALQLTRSMARNREFDQWALTPSGKPNSMNYFGNLKGIENIQPPLRLSLTPYVSAYYEKAPSYNPDGTYSYSNTFSYIGGADVKYGIDERFTVDMTLLPDFGQVQSDNKVKNLSYNEVTYSENRPFFQEGVELFNRGGLFYSRRIGRTPGLFYSVPYMLNPGEKIIENPSQAKLLNATKLSGRTDNGLGIGAFNAVTDNMNAVIEDSLGNKREILTEPLTNYNIIVFDQQVKNNSNIYFINTNVMRNSRYDDANVTGTGFTLNNKKNTFSTDGSASLSQKFSGIDSMPDMYRNQIGYNYFIGARKNGGAFQFGASHSVMNNTYNARDLGYYRPNSYVNEQVYVNYNIYQPRGIIRSSYNNASFNYRSHFITHKRTNASFNLNLYAQFLNYISIYGGGGSSPVSSYDYYEPRVEGRYLRTYQYYYTYAGFSSDYRKKLALDVNLNAANFYKNNIHNFENDLGYGAELRPRYRVNDRLTFTYSFNYYYDPYNPGFANVDTNGDIIMGARLLHTYTNVFTGKYIFKNDLSLSMNARHYWSTGEYLDYFVLQKNGLLKPAEAYTGLDDFSYNAFTVDAVFSWQFSPGSILSIVYKNAIEKDEYGAIAIPKFGDNFHTVMDSPQTNSVSVKVLYYLDYQMLKKLKVKKV